MRVFLILLVALSLPPFRLALAGPDTDLHGILTAAMKGTAVPGMGVAVIRGGKVADVAVAGVREMGQSDHAKADDPWQIGSDTKPITAALIVRLMEQRRLSLDVPLSTLWPDLAAKARPGYRGLTLREMLQHTSGLPHDISDTSRIDAAVHDRRPLPEQRRTYVEMAMKDPPVAPPGKEVHYSNTGYVLAAAIAEHVTGTLYETLVEQEIFEPLQMTSARFGLPAANRGHLKGRVATPEDEVPLMFDPAGGVSVDLSDWAKFCIDQLEGAKGHGRLLTPQGYKLLQSPDPATGNGLGWGFDATFMGRRGPMLSHSGSDGSWYSLVVLFPADGNGLLLNANAGPDMGGDKADKAVLKALLPSLAPPAK